MVSSPRMIIWKVKERATVGHSLPRRFKLLEELEKWLVPGAPLCWLQEYSPLPLFKSTCSPVTMSTEQSFKMNLECNSKNPFIAQLYRHFNYNFSNAKHAQFIPSALVTSASRKSSICRCTIKEYPRKSKYLHCSPTASSLLLKIFSGLFVICAGARVSQTLLPPCYAFKLWIENRWWLGLLHETSNSLHETSNSIL